MRMSDTTESICSPTARSSKSLAGLILAATGTRFANRTHHVLVVISRLYELDRATKNANVASRQKLRTEHAAPLLRDLKPWLDAEEFFPKSLIGKAVTYPFNQWGALNSYLEDSDLSIDNNAAERAMKPVAIGRKNGLFVGSPHAGRRAAILMTLIASCQAKCVEPWTWLRDVLENLLPGSPLELLLPCNWVKDYP